MKVSDLKKQDLGQIQYWDKNSNFAIGYEPVNVITKKPYRKQNKSLLTARARAQGYLSSYWGTWKHWRALGCRPLPGELPARIYVNRCYYCLWNLEQVSIPDDIPAGLEDAFNELIENEKDRAMEQGKMTRRDWQGYRWNCIRNHDGSRRNMGR